MMNQVESNLTSRITQSSKRCQTLTIADAANKYVSTLNWWLRSGPYAITKNFAYPSKYQLFTSDYALYWYDYEAGYDTVFAEFALSYNRTLNIDLCRGAATVQNKDWGVMITWKPTLNRPTWSQDQIFTTTCC